MLESFNFRLTQLAYIKGAMDQLAAFRPDGKTPAQVAATIAASQTVRGEYLTKRATLTTARGAFRGAQEDAHRTVVSVYAVMKSCYRDDRDSSRAIRSLPKDDRNPEQTLARMESISKLWAELPNPPGSGTPLSAGAVGRAAFNAQLAEFESARGTFTDCDQQFQMKEGALHGADRDNARFISAALVQGRAQFAPDTPEHAVIDAIPTEGGTQLPGQISIGVIESQAEGAVHLEFTADHATSFQVWHKGPGEAAFTQAEEVLLPGVYVRFGLPGGNHAYKVVGVNSRGEGPVSDVVTLTVAQAAAA